MSQEVADVLDRAADRIERCGLLKGKLWPDLWMNAWQAAEAEVPCCILGALSCEMVGTRVYYAAIVAVGRSAEVTEVADITRWNDAPRCTQEEVVAVLRQAAENERVAA